MTETLPDGFIGFAPELTHKTDRTHCDHCKEELRPDVYHACEGNREWKPPADTPTVSGHVHPEITEHPPTLDHLPAMERYHGTCPACMGRGTVAATGQTGPDALQEACPACGGVGQMRAK